MSERTIVQPIATCRSQDGQRVPLDSLVILDQEMLGNGTPPHYSFRYIDISSAAEGRLTIPAETITFRTVRPVGQGRSSGVVTF